MDTPTKAEPGQPSEETSVFPRLSRYAADALRYWEPRRLLYNGVLALVVVVHAFVAWPTVRDRLSLDVVLGVFLLAVLANVCYCAAYVVDVFVQFAGLHRHWRTGRTVLLGVGTAFAATITHFITKGSLGH
jgi:hypothetical protein